MLYYAALLPTGSYGREYLGSGVFLYQYTLLVNCSTMRTFDCMNSEYGWIVKIRNTSEAVLRLQ